MRVFPRFRSHHVALNSDWFIALFTFAMIGQKIYRVKVMYTAEILYVANSAYKHLDRHMFSRAFDCMMFTALFTVAMIGQNSWHVEIPRLVWQVSFVFVPQLLLMHSPLYYPAGPARSVLVAGLELFFLESGVSSST